METKKYFVNPKFKNCRVMCSLGVFLLDEKISQKNLKLLYENGYHDQITFS